MRNAHHQSIGYSPYFALYDFHMATHGSHYTLLKKFKLLGEPENILPREDELNVLRKQVKANIIKSSEINERQYNLRTKEVV